MATGRVKDNICFKHCRDQKVEVEIPERDGVTYKMVKRKIGYDDVMPILLAVSKMTPQTAVFQSFLFLFGRKGICPVPFVDPSLTELIILQDLCERYSTLPFAPGTLDAQPRWLMEAFREIVIARNEYTRDMQKKMESKRE